MQQPTSTILLILLTERGVGGSSRAPAYEDLPHRRATGTFVAHAPPALRSRLKEQAREAGEAAQEG